MRVEKKKFRILANYFPDPKSRPAPTRFRLFRQGPTMSGKSSTGSICSMIQRARKRIWLTTPYFVPTEATLFALTSAALRGVDVRLLVPRMSDSRLVTSAARSYFDELMRAGVRIWEYHGRMLHSKTIVVDHHYSLIGTANFDSRSFRLNFEVCDIAAHGPRLAELLSDQFECDLRPAPERRPFQQTYRTHPENVRGNRTSFFASAVKKSPVYGTGLSIHPLNKFIFI